MPFLSIAKAHKGIIRNNLFDRFLMLAKKIASIFERVEIVIRVFERSKILFQDSFKLRLSKVAS